MTNSKTITEKIAETQEKIAQYQNQMKRLLNQQKEQERKARTHRLIERGALLESMLDGAEGMTNEEVKALLQAVLPRTAADEMPKPVPGTGA